MKSIRWRIVGNFMMIIVITVTIIEAMILYIIRESYYKNLEDNLTNQIIISSKLYSKYFSDMSMNDLVSNDVDTFFRQTPAEVEIFDNTGTMLLDSIGVFDQSKTIPSDVKNALKGSKGVSENSRFNVMTVSYPLRNSKGSITGVLRFIVTLNDVENTVSKLVLIFIFIGILVIVVVGILALFLSDTIVKPLNEVTKVASKMAEGNLNIRNEKKYDDEIGKLSNTLNYMAEEINNKEQLKNDFISSVSHELRTPLTSIKGWAVTLRESSIEDREIFKDGLDIIEKESDRLSSMVEELLDFSKFVSGKITMKNEMVDLKKILTHIEKQLEPRAQREDKLFTVMFPDNMPVIFTDGNRLKQLFINIIDNSFKFTSPGGYIKLIAECRDGRVSFKIIDNGAGIPKDELPRVKEKFFKGKTSKSQNGIGLSICDEIVKLMQGSFEIVSEVDKGTEVYISFPYKEGV